LRRGASGAYARVMPPGVGLSKSRVMAPLQCHKRLWWTVHEPTAPELRPDGALQALFDDGLQVGQVARTYVPGGVLIDLPYDAIGERLAATRAALERGEGIIYEAAFREDPVFGAVDILERTPAGVAAIEVKSTTKVKEPQHLPDVTSPARERIAGVAAAIREQLSRRGRRPLHAPRVAGRRPRRSAAGAGRAGHPRLRWRARDRHVQCCLRARLSRAHGRRAPSPCRAPSPHRGAARRSAPRRPQPRLSSRFRRQLQPEEGAAPLVPELRYDALPIQDGETASLELERLLLRGAELMPGSMAELRDDLLRYCRQDTRGLVKLLDRLRRLAQGAG